MRGLRINTAQPVARHWLNEGLLYWQLFHPHLWGLGARDLTRRNKPVYTGEPGDFRTATPGQARRGGRGALHLVGDDYITVPDRPHFRALTGLTICGVFFNGAWSVDGFRPLVSKRNKVASSGIEFGFFMQRGGGGTTINVSATVSSDGTTATTTTYNYTSAYVESVPQWWAMTWDGANQRIYLNGAQVATGAASFGAIATGTNNVVIGAWSNLTDFHTGPIDDVRILGRAYSADEVRQWYYMSRCYNDELLNYL